MARSTRSGEERSDEIYVRTYEALLTNPQSFLACRSLGQAFSVAQAGNGGPGELGRLWNAVLSCFDQAHDRGDLKLQDYLVRLPEAFASACLAKTGEGVTVMPDYADRPNNSRSGANFGALHNSDKVGRLVLPASEEYAKATLVYKNGSKMFDEVGARGVVVSAGKWVTVACGGVEFKLRSKQLKVVA